MINMKILVLGSEGQIGKPFCKFAKSAGHEVIYIDKKLGHDLSDRQICVDFLSNINYDACVFLAFEVGGSKFLLERDKTFQYISENVRLMENVFQFLRTKNKPFLFASSQMANMHHTNYGFLKDLGERYTRTLNGHICRFWNVYGEESPNDPKSHVITDFIYMAKRGNIVMRTKGNEERQFLHVEDCSKALLHWCENYTIYDKSEYIDITSFIWNSVLDIANTVKKLIPCEITQGSNSDVIQCGIKNNPSEYVLKFWKPEVSLLEGIRKLI